MSDKLPADLLDNRKEEHINLASKSQFRVQNNEKISSLFTYEPLFSTSINVCKNANEFKRSDYSLKYPCLQKEIFNKKCTLPLWVSSMTGGTKKALPLNQTLAKVSNHFGLGMGLGSCRPLLEESMKNNIPFKRCKNFADFNLRPYLKNNLPLVANLGIAQIEKLIKIHGAKSTCGILEEMLDSLGADGIFVHINLLQEFLQPEGDVIEVPVFETLCELLKYASFNVAVKEVGQGMGPKSLRHLMQLPLAAIEFAALGGTNFSQLEILRGGPKALNVFSEVGHEAGEMLDFVLSLKEQLSEKLMCKHFIVSGGIAHFLQGHYFVKRLEQKGLEGFYGQAHFLLDLAHQGESALMDYVNNVANGLAMALQVLEIKER